MKRIYLCGSHSTGKTTLGQELCRRHDGWLMVHEIAREIIKRDKVDLSSFKTDVAGGDYFQMEEDGVRCSLSLDLAWNITNRLLFLLEIEGIPYIRIQTTNVIERIRLVEAVTR